MTREEGGNLAQVLRECEKLQNETQRWSDSKTGSGSVWIECQITKIEVLLKAGEIEISMGAAS